MITDTVGNNNRLIYFQARPGWLISDPRLVLVNVFADQDYYTSHTRRRDRYVNAVLMRPLFLAPSGAQGVTMFVFLFGTSLSNKALNLHLSLSGLSMGLWPISGLPQVPGLLKLKLLPYFVLQMDKI